MKILLARHGEAQVASASTAGPELTEWGRKSVAQEAQVLASCGVQVNHVVHSPKARATQTAKILAEAIDIKKSPFEVSEHILSDSDVYNFAEEINSYQGDTLIVSHLPFVSHLVSYLLLGRDDLSIVQFHPGTMVCLEKQRMENRWILSWIVSPNLLASKME